MTVGIFTTVLLVTLGVGALAGTRVRGARDYYVAGGGTGGHLYPALAVAGELRRRDPRVAIVFVGARRGLERRLVPQAGFPLYTLSLDSVTIGTELR